MRVVLIAACCLSFGTVAMANVEPIANAHDSGEARIDLQIPQTPETPLIQNYYTVTGLKAAVVTPDEGDSYYVVPTQQAYQTQFPQEREADVPTTDAGWVLIGW